jgi:cytochrome c553
LNNFRSGLPHDTSNDFLLGSVAQPLDDDSIQALAAWIGSLNPAKCFSRLHNFTAVHPGSARTDSFAVEDRK